MTVTVRLFAQLRDYGPGGAGQARLEVPDGATVLDVADQLGFGHEPCEIMVNNERAHHGIKVDEGDVISFFPALAGG